MLVSATRENVRESTASNAVYTVRTSFFVYCRRGFAPHLSLGRTLVSLDLSAIGAGQAREESYPVAPFADKPAPTQMQIRAEKTENWH